MLILNKTVDYSVLTAGFSIPIVLQQALYEKLGFWLKHGESRDIQIDIDGTLYEAKLKNIGFDQEKFAEHKDILQVRYSAGSPIAKKFRQVFCHTAERLKELYITKKSHKITMLAEEEREYFALYSTKIPNILAADCMTNRAFLEESAAICRFPEQEAELLLDRVDETADLILQTKVKKIRKLNRTIERDLKKAYGYRCQICGQLIGEKYSSHLVHAHHIRYFTQSKDNSMSNIMVVCPNHHGIIHDTNPVFDFKTKTYTYPNGYVEGLALNLHL